MAPLPVFIPHCHAGMTVRSLAVSGAHFGVDSRSATIEIYDQIGEPGTTPARISGALAAIGDKHATVRLNSPGGDFYAGLAIFNLLVQHPAGVTTEVVGIAASAAAIVAQAGVKRLMAKDSQIMLHRASSGATGNASVMREVATVLDKIDALMVGIFADRTNLPRASVAAMIQDGDCFLSAEEATAMRFADEIMAQAAVPARTFATAGVVPGPRPSPRELEEDLRKAGFSRAVAARMTAAASRKDDTENDIDLEKIASVASANFAALAPRLR